MNSRPWLVAASAIGVAVALVWWLRPERVTVSFEDAAQIAAVPLEPAVTGAGVPTRAPPPDSSEVATAPRQAGDAPSAASAPLEPPRAPLPGETSTPMTLLLGSAQKEFPATIAANERRFAAEPIDAVWAPSAEAQILGTIAQATVLKLLDLRVHCRSTMCQLQLTMPKPGNESTPPIDGIETLGFNPRSIVFLTDPSGTLNLVAYVPRGPDSDDVLQIHVKQNE